MVRWKSGILIALITIRVLCCPIMKQRHAISEIVVYQEVDITNIQASGVSQLSVIRLEWESAVLRGSHSFQTLEEERLQQLKELTDIYLQHYKEVGPKLTQVVLEIKFTFKFNFLLIIVYAILVKFSLNQTKKLKLFIMLYQ